MAPLLKSVNIKHSYNHRKIDWTAIEFDCRAEQSNSKDCNAWWETGHDSAAGKPGKTLPEDSEDHREHFQRDMASRKQVSLELGSFAIIVVSPFLQKCEPL